MSTNNQKSTTPTTTTTAPFPLDHLPDVIRDAVLAAQYLVQAPLEMCGQSVLAAANFAIQGHVGLDMPVYGSRPANLFLVTLGATGERKSGVDRLVLTALTEWEKDQFASYEERRDRQKEQCDAWDARKAAILKDKTLTDRQKAKEIEKLGNRPLMPLFPKRTCREPTVEGLNKLFRDGYPSIGMFSDEAGSLLGGYAMNKDNALRTAAVLSDLWDGKGIERVRGGDELGMMYGRRLCLHLMVQPKIAATLLDNRVFTEQGFSARLLVANPRSTVGSRFFRRSQEDRQEEQQHRRKLAAFNRCVRDCLDSPARTVEGDRQQLDPRLLRFSPEAETIWMDWADAIEAECREGGKFRPILGLANKAAEHTARLAATLAAFEDLAVDRMEVRHVEAGMHLMAYYLDQALSLLGQIGEETDEGRDLEELETWLRQEWDEPHITYTLMCQYVPGKFRKRKDLIARVIQQWQRAGLLLPAQDVPVRGRTRKTAFEIVPD